MSKKNDIYGRAVEYFKRMNEARFRKEIERSWTNPSGYVVKGKVSNHGQLFKFVRLRSEGSYSGCLTMIKDCWNQGRIFNSPLLNEIGIDKKMPDRSDHITKENIHLFAKYQRRVDKEEQR